MGKSRSANFVPKVLSMEKNLEGVQSTYERLDLPEMKPTPRIGVMTSQIVDMLLV